MADSHYVQSPQGRHEEMKAGVVTPGLRGSASVVDMDVPALQRGEVLVRILEVGIDGTDLEISEGRYGEAPPGQDSLVLGHEALGEVEEGEGMPFQKGDLVVPLVRRPDGCANCRDGRSDMCTEGNYTECGIRGRHGFLREYVSEHPEFLVKVPESLRHVAVLSEPMSIVAKGLTQAMEFHLRGSDPVRVGLVLGADASAEIGEDHRSESHLIPLVLAAALKESEFTIFGDDYDTPDGTAVRDYVHVTDLAEAHVLALEALDAGAAHHYNVGNGSGHSVSEVVATCRSVTGCDICAEIGERRPGDPPVLVAASEKIKKELGWKPQFTDLADIIRSAWAWHSTHPDGYGD